MARNTLVAPVPRRLRQGDREILEEDVWLVDGGRGRFLTSILGASDSDFPGLIRFDEGCMRPADHPFGAARKVILDVTSMHGRTIQWQPGRTVIIDNWRTLHARAPFCGRDDDRVLERVLVRS